MCSRESLGISQQPVPGPWGLLPISASSQGTRVRFSLSLDPSGASVTWDDCSEEAWLFYYSKTTGGPHCRLIGVDSCHLQRRVFLLPPCHHLLQAALFCTNSTGQLSAGDFMGQLIPS